MKIHHASKRRRGFTLVEIMIVMSIIGLLAVISIPNYLRSRKKSQATIILEDLRSLDGAIDQYAIENNKSSGSTVTWTDLVAYVKTGSRLYSSGGNDILGNPFTIPVLQSPPKVNSTTFAALSDIAPASFWSPYN